MAITKSFTYKNFQPSTGILVVTVTFNDGTVDYETIDMPIQLPIDSLGNVPTGDSLTSFVNEFVDLVFPENVLEQKNTRRNLTLSGGVVANAASIEAITSEDEEEVQEQQEQEIANLRPSGTGVPVIIRPDRTFQPSGNTYTRSTIIAVGDPASYGASETGVFPDAETRNARIGVGQSILDNGNVYPSSLQTVTKNAVIGASTNTDIVSGEFDVGWVEGSQLANLRLTDDECNAIKAGIDYSSLDSLGFTEQQKADFIVEMENAFDVVCDEWNRFIASNDTADAAPDNSTVISGSWIDAAAIIFDGANSLWSPTNGSDNGRGQELTHNGKTYVRGSLEGTVSISITDDILLNVFGYSRDSLLAEMRAVEGYADLPQYVRDILEEILGDMADGLISQFKQISGTYSVYNYYTEQRTVTPITQSYIRNIFDDRYSETTSLLTSSLALKNDNVDVETSPPAHIKSTYPTVFDPATFSGSDDNLHYFYIEHAPITITTEQAYGWFQYT